MRGICGRAASRVSVALLGSAALALVSAASAQTAQNTTKADGSLYVQCDGHPNNVTGGETAARLLGAITLIGLFAPGPESADASKRKFGSEGVAACTALIDGERKEGNAERRLGLLLGRAVHQIEAKDYDAAIADVGRARGEAEAAGLTGNPAFERNRGRAFDNVEALARFRKGEDAAAHALAMRSTPVVRGGLIQLLTATNYAPFVRDGGDAERAFLDARTRVYPGFAGAHADRLEEMGRFAEAAALRDALVDFERFVDPETMVSANLAKSAMSHALAGNMDMAATRAAEAKANFEKRRASATPEANGSAYVEVMDLYALMLRAHEGKAAEARPLFAARSQWVEASFGSVMEVNRRLRAGAAPTELTGALAMDADAMWKDRAATKRAAMLASDSDNKTLFGAIPGGVSSRSYEALSRNVWRADKSKIVLKPGAKAKNPAVQPMLIHAAGLVETFDGYTLHGALVAKARGHDAFVMIPVIQKEFAAALLLTGKMGDPGLHPAIANDADTVIAQLSPLIPSPETIAARRKVAAR